MRSERASGMILDTRVMEAHHLPFLLVSSFTDHSDAASIQRRTCVTG
jgi:hypothetical protein